MGFKRVCGWTLLNFFKLTTFLAQPGPLPCRPDSVLIRSKALFPLVSSSILVGNDHEYSFWVQ